MIGPTNADWRLLAEKMALTDKYPPEARNVALWAVHIVDALEAMQLQGHHPELAEEPCFKKILWLAGLVEKP